MQAERLRKSRLCRELFVVHKKPTNKCTVVNKIPLSGKDSRKKVSLPIKEVRSDGCRLGCNDATQLHRIGNINASSWHTCAVSRPATESCLPDIACQLGSNGCQSCPESNVVSGKAGIDVDDHPGHLVVRLAVAGLFAFRC